MKAFKDYHDLPEVQHFTFRVALRDIPTSSYTIIQHTRAFHAKFCLWELAHHLPHLVSLELEGHLRGAEESPMQPFIPIDDDLLHPFIAASRGLWPHLRRLCLENVDFESAAWLVNNVSNNSRGLNILILHNTFGQKGEGAENSRAYTSADYSLLKLCPSPRYVEILCVPSTPCSVGKGLLEKFFKVLLHSYRTSYGPTYASTHPPAPPPRPDQPTKLKGFIPNIPVTFDRHASNKGKHSKKRASRSDDEDDDDYSDYDDERKN